jgi:hypothetical protein
MVTAIDDGADTITVALSGSILEPGYAIHYIIINP